MDAEIEALRMEVSTLRVEVEQLKRWTLLAAQQSTIVNLQPLHKRIENLEQELRQTQDLIHQSQIAVH